MKRILAGVAGVITGIVPMMSCPACWPAYASIFSSLGISFLMYGTGQIALVGTLLVVALTMLAIDWRNHRRIGPLVLGFIGALFEVYSRSTTTQAVISYSGSVLFIDASIWNGLILRNNRSRSSTKSQDCSCCKGDV